MKTILILIAVIVFTPMTAQNNCSSFYPARQGQKIVIHQLDKRENLDIISEYTVTQSNSAGFTMKNILKNKRGKPIVETSFKARCSGNTTQLDPTSIMSGMMQQYEGMEYTITGDDISIPNSLAVGQQLPDASVTMEVDADIMKITTTVTMENRKVDRRETITTPAGTFDCYVITYTNTLEMGMTKTMYSTQWLAKGVGMVQEETRKPNGKLITKSILQSIN